MTMTVTVGKSFKEECVKRGILPGAVVEIVRPVLDEDCEGETGFTSGNIEDSEQFVGQTAVVDSIENDVYLPTINGGSWWPWWCLKVVKPAPHVKIVDNTGWLTIGSAVSVGNLPCEVVDIEDQLIGVRYLDDDGYIHYYDISDIYPYGYNKKSMVNLNDDYTAVINHQDGMVIVGCQEIPFEAVERLYKEMKAQA